MHKRPESDKIQFSSTFRDCSASAILGQTTTHINTDSDRKVKSLVSGFEGIVVAGYVDDGAFLNFSGLNINLTTQHHKLILGMLLSFRFKKDVSPVKNEFVFPTLGVDTTFPKHPPVTAHGILELAQEYH